MSPHAHLRAGEFHTGLKRPGLMISVLNLWMTVKK